MIKIKKIVWYNVFFIFMILFSQCSAMEDSLYNDMMHLYDEVHCAVKKWETELDDIMTCMFESAELKIPKKYIEGDQLKAVFDAVNERITLYDIVEGQPLKCYSLTYDYFLLYFEIQSVSDKPAQKKCILQ